MVKEKTTCMQFEEAGLERVQEWKVKLSPEEYRGRRKFTAPKKNMCFCKREPASS